MKKIISLLMVLVLCLAACAAAAESGTPDLFGTQDGAKYENPVMGLGCNLEGWSYYSKEDILARYNMVMENSSEEALKLLEDNSSVIVMYAETSDQLQCVNLVVDGAAAAYVKIAGEETYFQDMKGTYEQLAPGMGWENFSCEIAQIEISGKTVNGLKCQYVLSGIQVYQIQAAFLAGDYVSICTVTSYFDDKCDSILQNFYLLEQ